MMSIVKVTEMQIKDFRIFKEKRIKLGNMITAIAGSNGTGKSTLLALIGNSMEYKRSSELQHKNSYFRPNRYRTEFSEILRGSLQYDKPGSNLITFNFSDGDYRICRTTWQTIDKITGEKRFRVIPEIKADKTKGISKSSKKKTLPVIYLGLSRLYPIGESKQIAPHNIEISSTLDAEGIAWIKSKAKEILYMFNVGTINGITKVSLGDVKRKTGVGFNTDKYDYVTNSAGQDNVGQILSAIWKFKVLKDELADDYNGGVLLIDEVDATLHPASQRKLFDVLVRSAREFKIQIVFTVHSLSLIEEIIRRSIQDTSGNIVMNYLTNANGTLEIYQQLPMRQIENEMQVQINPNQPQIKLYTEDAEARWFLHNMLNKFGVQYSSKFSIVENMQCGNDWLIGLYKADPEIFTHTIIILDGDSKKKLAKQSIPADDSHFVLLPGQNLSPEELFLDFLLNIVDARDAFFSQSCVKEAGFNKQALQQINIEAYAHNEAKKREMLKEWFNRSLSILENGRFFDLWYARNVDLVDKFKQELVKSFNTLAAPLKLE